MAQRSILWQAVPLHQQTFTRFKGPRNKMSASVYHSSVLSQRAHSNHCRPNKYTHSFPHRRQRIEDPAVEGPRQQQQDVRQPNVAQLQSDVNTELDVAVAEAIDEGLARAQQQAGEAEVMKVSILANESMGSYKQSMANAGWYTKEWLANTMTKANNILANVPIPVINLPVAPLVEYYNQLPAMSTLKSRGNKKWEEITTREAHEARKVTDKHLESYNDEEGWEVVDRKDKGSEAEKKSQSK